MRRDKRQRNKPIPVEDLQTVAKFRAELVLYKRVRDEGHSRYAAMMAVFGDDE